MGFLIEKQDNVLAKSARFSTLVYLTLAFSIVIIPSADSWMPVGIIAAGFLVYGTNVPSFAFVAAPFVVLFVSILLSSTLWRSVLFLVGLLMLMAEWLYMVTFKGSHIWFSIMTSLPYIVIVSYWTAISLNAILRRQKQSSIAQ